MLCEFAERGLGRTYTSFPRSQLRAGVENAVCNMRLPFLEQIMYAPLQTAEVRAQTWRENAPKLVNQTDLFTWLNEPAMINQALTTQQMNQAFEDLMQRIESDSVLCQRVVQHVKALNFFTVAKLDTLVNDLFKPAALAAPLPELTFSVEQNWSAAAFLKQLKITNASIENNLRDFEADVELFDAYNKETMLSQLIAWGAVGTEAARIIKALAAANLIK